MTAAGGDAKIRREFPPTDPGRSTMFKRILVPTDGSELSGRAVTTAIGRAGSADHSLQEPG